ncbi:(2Fe-2S) ferredoxin domain-containing protein [Rhodobium gokarnense]|uniref:(2Fe-2S) ferredoxin n=1 Tax=Rhodobium gokarnense TaxID=364296 RepID=A0ABT3H919_9HYPH|nr:(2Fe-2S) ferredoxin domain-containing protein [Rhodobium gokarnense]MCW2306900.1 (2Fe-2S) ferredoxin [Rhodobium gokarnense]
MLPKPEKHVFVCAQSREPGHPFGSCAENKAEDTFLLFLAEVKARALEGRVQVTNSGCLGGPCAEGPTVVVYPDGVKYRNVREPEDIAAIFDEHLIAGTPVVRLQVATEGWG